MKNKTYKVTVEYWVIGEIEITASNKNHAKQMAFKAITTNNLMYDLEQPRNGCMVVKVRQLV